MSRTFVAKILAYLKCIEGSNLALANHVDSVEEQKWVFSTPQDPRSRTQVGDDDLSFLDSPFLQNRGVIQPTRPWQMLVKFPSNFYYRLQLDVGNREGCATSHLSTEVVDTASSTNPVHTNDRSRDSNFQNW